MQTTRIAKARRRAFTETNVLGWRVETLGSATHKALSCCGSCIAASLFKMAPQVGSDARGSFKMASVFPKQPPVGTFPLARWKRCWLLGDELAYLIPVNQECLPERKRTNDGAVRDQTKPRVSAQIDTHKTDISLHECHDVIQSKSATGTKAKMTTKL